MGPVLNGALKKKYGRILTLSFCSFIPFKENETCYGDLVEQARKKFAIDPERLYGTWPKCHSKCINLKTFIGYTQKTLKQ